MDVIYTVDAKEQLKLRVEVPAFWPPAPYPCGADPFFITAAEDHRGTSKGKSLWKRDKNIHDKLRNAQDVMLSTILRPCNSCLSGSAIVIQL